MIATGFDFEPLPNGDVLVEFHGDDGSTINSQVITTESLARMPLVIRAFFLAIEAGQEAALEYLHGLNEGSRNE